MPQTPHLYSQTMRNKKGQVGIKELILTLVLAGLLFIVGLLVFANVTNVTDNILDPDSLTTINESVTISANSDSSDNSTLLAISGYIANSETVKNQSAPNSNLTRNSEYVITSTLVSGDLNNRANFTLLNISDTGGVDGYNGSALSVTYRSNVKSSAQTTSDNLQTTVLDSFSLGVVALIVLAAVVILGVLFTLGSQ